MHSARGLGTDAGVAGGEVGLVPILLPIALKRTTMKVVAQHPGRTSNLLKSEKSSTTERLEHIGRAFSRCRGDCKTSRPSVPRSFKPEIATKKAA
jgi:hypothetical protein